MKLNLPVRSFNTASPTGIASQAASEAAIEPQLAIKLGLDVSGGSARRTSEIREKCVASASVGVDLVRSGDSRGFLVGRADLRDAGGDPTWAGICDRQSICPFTRIVKMQNVMSG